MKLNVQLDDLQVFCLAARRASFAAAATELGMSPAFVSKRIAVLEKALGVVLFHRAARRVTVSADGERVYAAAQRVLEGVDELADSVAGGRLDPQGTLRVTTSFRLGRTHVGPILSRLAQQVPGLAITLDAVDRRVDLVAENVDLDVRIADEIDEPHLVAHRLADSTRVLCAAPDYLARCGAPATLAELARHDCLVLRDRNQAFGVWRLLGPPGMQKVKVTGRLASNNAEIVRGWGADGHGILLQSRWDVGDDLRAGRLRHVLPEWTQPATLWAVSTVRLGQSAKVRVCVEFLRAQLAQGPFALVPETLVPDTPVPDPPAR